MVIIGFTSYEIKELTWTRYLVSFLMRSHCRNEETCMRTTVYWIEGPWSGRLAIVPRPRGGDWLEEEVRSWKEAGLDVVVSLLTHDKNIELELNQEELLCRTQGIQFYAYPIQDRGVPTSRKATTDLVEKLEKLLETGKSVAIHCRQGIGRSSLIAVLLLVSAGIDPGAALAQISQERGCAVPDTFEQSNWIKSFAVTPVST